MVDTTFLHKNKNYILAFLVIAFLLILIIFYNVTGGFIVPAGDTSAGGEVGVDIAVPPREVVIEQETVIYHEKTVNLRHDYGLFETELKSYGFYEHDGKTEFRMDIWVHNVGTDSEDFLWEHGKIKQVPNIQYDVTSAEFDGSEIPSEVPESLSGDATFIIGHSVAFSTILDFTSQAPHTFEITIN
jgi:hypothetical protein